MTTHGMSNTTEYKTWERIKKRCYNKNVYNYCDYGGRGILMCDEWKNSFEVFYKDMGDRPEGTSIDRIDNDKGYSKENCRWATNEEQCNNRRSNINITYKGETQTLAQWCRELNLEYQTVKARIQESGMTPDDAFELEHKRKGLYTVDGVEKHISEWLKLIKIDKSTFAYRVKKGWSLNKIKNTPIRENKRYILNYNGEIRPLKEWCSILNLNLKMVRERLRRGWDSKRALEEPIRLKYNDKKS